VNVFGPHLLQRSAKRPVAANLEKKEPVKSGIKNRACQLSAGFCLLRPVMFLPPGAEQHNEPSVRSGGGAAPTSRFEPAAGGRRPPIPGFATAPRGLPARTRARRVDIWPREPESPQANNRIYAKPKLKARFEPSCGGRDRRSERGLHPLGRPRPKAGSRVTSCFCRRDKSGAADGRLPAT
jgi:hypothetical protein